MTLRISRSHTASSSVALNTKWRTTSKPFFRKSLKRFEVKSSDFRLSSTTLRSMKRSLAKDDAKQMRQAARCPARLTRPVIENRITVPRERFSVDFKRKAATAKIVNDHSQTRITLRACQFVFTNR